MNRLRDVFIALHTTHSESAAGQLGVDWAKRSGATVHGVAVVDETVAEATAVPIGVGALVQEQRKELLAKRRQLARQRQDEFTQHCREAGVEFSAEVRTGVPHEVVAEEMQSHDLALVDDQSAIEYGPGESPRRTVNQLLKLAARPVVVVPEKRPTGKSILVAVDGSAPASRAVFALLATGLAAVGDLHLLTIDRESKEKARGRAQRTIDYLNRRQVANTFEAVVSEQPPSEVICEEATRGQCELIVMGPHARSALAELVLGSVTQQVLDRTTVPVFLYH